MQTARTIDSYSATLKAVLKAFKPKHVYEWGSGLSTDLMATFPSVLHIDSVEDSDSWYEQYMKRKPLNVEVYHRPKGVDYQKVNGKFKEYDLFFVDGKCRVECLDELKKHMKPKTVVILHDAERPQYDAAILKFQYKKFTDNGSTVILAESKEANEILSSIAVS